MKSIITVLATLLLLFCLPQHVTSQWKRQISKGLSELKNPTRNIHIKKEIKPWRQTTQWQDLSNSWKPFSPPNVLRGCPATETVSITANTPLKELHRMDLDWQYPVSMRLYQNIPPIQVLPIPLLGALASSFKANPSLCGKWRVIERESNDLQLESELTNNILKDEFINISEDGVSFFSCGQSILSKVVKNDYINSLNNEIRITWQDENIIVVHYGDCSKELVLYRVPEEIPSPIGHTIGNSTPPHIITLPQRTVEADIQSHLSHHVKIDRSSNTNIESNEWWIDYIGKIIEEQQIKQGIEQMQEQLFEKGMKFDFEYEWKDGEVGFIIFTYGYKLDAA